MRLDLIDQLFHNLLQKYSFRFSPSSPDKKGQIYSQSSLYICVVEVNILDLVFGGLIVYGGFKGFRKGVIVELTSLLALVLGSMVPSTSLAM